MCVYSIYGMYIYVVCIYGIYGMCHPYGYGSIEPVWSRKGYTFCLRSLERLRISQRICEPVKVFLNLLKYSLQLRPSLPNTLTEILAILQYGVFIGFFLYSYACFIWSETGCLFLQFGLNYS